MFEGKLTKKVRIIIHEKKGRERQPLPRAEALGEEVTPRLGV
jgi:hypothetical protein